MTQPSAKRILIGAISPAAPGPLYQQIIDGIKREISEGRLTPGSELPSFRALAEQLLVSLITVKRAYEELERGGIIYRHQGLGTFVAEQGDHRSREGSLTAAREHFQKAIQEAKQAGLSDREVLKLAQELINEGKNQ